MRIELSKKMIRLIIELFLSKIKVKSKLIRLSIHGSNFKLRNDSKKERFTF